MLGFFVRLGVFAAVAYVAGGGLGVLVAVGLFLVVELLSRAFLQLSDKLGDLSSKFDALFNTAVQTLDLSVEVRQDVKFLPRSLERIEGKLSGIEARIERIEARIERIKVMVGRIEDAAATDLDD